LQRGKKAKHEMLAIMLTSCFKKSSVFDSYPRVSTKTYDAKHKNSTCTNGCTSQTQSHARVGLADAAVSLGISFLRHMLIDHWV
jgi:hypothetical protein